ncbi:dioxygenase [Thetidibacter halocola]|uniref:Glutathione S-transferase C-terminal domain-containing protein n=1 Tax=Thetidibacter halocola TaxID=2827239 RepID=A0A8J7WBF7_9RHOB|nr:dioxygenase [Thetidibacter halocola]MBS0124460.1 glutathione S-transferase C-terminal domain-containing protein [Thetidibacter halocola]
MADRTIRDYVTAADAAIADPLRMRAVGGGSPRFVLYGSAFSICTQKLRMVLLEKGAGFAVRDMEILPPRMENTHPDYVRLRLQGVQGREMVHGFTGRSSVATEGVDPVAVPTLVDLDEGRVHVDALAIAGFLDRTCAGPELIPARLKREVDRACATADSLPQIAIMYGAHPDGDFRPKALREALAGAHDTKILKLMEGRSLSVGHPKLIAAYDAKIRKEAAGRHYVRDGTLMRDAVAEMVAGVAALDGQLKDGQDWLFDAFTLADIWWAATLYRMQWLGMGFAWEGGHPLNETPRPRVAAYLARLTARPSFREGVTGWPGFPVSEYVAAPQAKKPEAPQRATKRTVAAVEGHGRDIREESLTGAVLATMKGTQNPRARAVLNAFTRHLHAFLEEVQPTEAEWEWGIEFLTKTGHLSKGGRQEFILLSDVMGATARVDLINNRFPSGATENSVLGPFYVDPRPTFENGADISAGIKGAPMFFNARVLDTEGRPIAGARVDIWHADGDGGYDILMDGVEAAMRGLFRSDSQGRVWFTSILAESYPIPDDGTVGQLLHTARRNIMRPAHVHVRIEAPGYRRLTTMLFVDGDPYLDADPVFGVKQSLVVPFEKRDGQRAPDGKPVPQGAWCVDYDFVLARSS